DCHLLLIRHAAVEDLDGPLLEFELVSEVFLQPGKRGDALGEYNCARRATRADANGFELFDQGGELLGVVRSDLVIELGESLEGLPFLCRDGGGREAVVNRLIRRGWCRKERLGESPAEAVVVAGTGGSWGNPHAFELCGNGTLFGRRRNRNVLGLGTFGPHAADNASDLGRVAVTADDESRDGLAIDGAVRHDTRGVEKTQNLLEGFGVAVVRRGRGQDERVRRRRKNACQLIVLRSDVGGVVNLVDDDGIPVDFFQVGAVLRGLERVEGDNHAWEVRKRVAGSRQLLPDLLDAYRVQAHERDGKPRPHLLLHLFHDVLR